MSTELAKQGETALVESDYGENEFQGDTEASIQEVMIPFLTILQGNHEEVKKQLIPGCCMGDILERTNDKIHKGDKGVHLITVYKEHVVEEWPNEEDGGGNLKVATYKLTDPIWVEAQATQKFPKYVNPENGNPLSETVNLWALLVDGERVAPVVIVFKSKKLKYWTKWIKKALALKLGSGQVPPFQAHQIRLVTFEDIGKDQAGNDVDFANVNLRPLNGTTLNSLLAPGSDLLAQATEMRKKIAEGFYKLDPRGEIPSVDSDDDEDDPNKSIPF